MVVACLGVTPIIYRWGAKSWLTLSLSLKQLKFGVYFHSSKTPLSDDILVVEEERTRSTGGRVGLRRAVQVRITVSWRGFESLLVHIVT